MPSLLKLAHERAARVAQLAGGSLLVGVSGKDSFVTLDIARPHFKNLQAFHMYHVRGMACEETPIRALCSRLKVPLHFVPHPDVCRMIKRGVLRPHKQRADNMPELKRSDCEALARKLAGGIEWVAYGERLADSFARRLFWRKQELQGIYEKGKRASFIPDWLTRDVEAYVVAKKLPAPCTWGQSTTSTGFELTPQLLGWLRDRHPADYERVLRVFPAAGTLLMPQ